MNHCEKLSYLLLLKNGQINKPDKQLSSRAALQNNRPKKKPARPFSCVEDDEDSKALDMIRQMFK